MEKFNGSAFMRDVYLHSNPSVDIDKVEGAINPSHYTIHEHTVYALMRKYGVLDGNNQVLNADWNLGVNMWLLNKGPRILRDAKAA